MQKNRSEVKVTSSDTLKSFQTLTLQGHKVDIACPEGKIKANLLLLPGWDFPKEDWCNQTELCKKALRLGYCLILPEMGKSVYIDSVLPETRVDWRKYPTRQWLRDILIPMLQKQYGILLKDQYNYVLGLSTGARGALLIGIDRPDLFRGIAALSGDYDPTLMPNDRLIEGFYGKYKDFPERWKHLDNIITQVPKLRSALYIGHGRRDPVVPYEQSEHLYKKVKQDHAQLTVRYHLDQEAHHDYTYWNSEVEPILDFFQQLR